MLETSIRAFTLDYYRSLGAEVSPLDDQRLAWSAWLPQENQARTLQFGPEGLDGEAWHEMLQRCLDARTVACRHIVGGAVHRAVETFAERLPGFGVVGATMRRVDRRSATGFTHRVSYEAPASPSRTEELHHDLLDLVTGERLEGLSDRFYQFATIPLAPPEDLSRLDLEPLLARSLEALDARTRLRASTLEADLEPALTERLASIGSYYDGLVADVLKAEEQEIDARIADLSRRIAQTKLPGAIAKMQADLERAFEELAQLRERREQDARDIRRAAEERLADERLRHEVLVESHLISLALVTYDIVRYGLELADGERTAHLEVGYVPVTRELLLPPCPACQRIPDEASRLRIDDGDWACAICAGWQAPPPPPRPRLMPTEIACGACASVRPARDIQRCHVTGVPLCPACVHTCDECGQTTSRAELHPHPSGRGMICSRHGRPCRTCETPLKGQRPFRCSRCEGRHCRSHRTSCRACGQPACPDCLADAGGCPACASLAPLAGEDALVGEVIGLIPPWWRLRASWTFHRTREATIVAWEALGVEGRATRPNVPVEGWTLRLRLAGGAWKLFRKG
ncbi:MAG: hypothetical protein VKP72_12355 [bacterium]|nr:hypothetical protein [bacterium]